MSFLGISSLMYSKNIFLNILFGKSPISTNLVQALRIAKEANELRLAKKLTQAQDKYLEAIDLVPNDTRFYDGLRKVWVVQKRHIEVVNLYEKAFKLFPTNADFVKRLADVYKQYFLGNRTVTEYIISKNNYISLDGKIEELYNRAEQLSVQNTLYKRKKNKHHLRVLYTKSIDKVKKNKEYGQRTYKIFQNNSLKHNNFNVDQLYTFLNKSKFKKRRQLTSVQRENLLKYHRQLSFKIIKKLSKTRNWQSAISIAEENYREQPHDAQSFRQLKTLYIQNNRWNEVVKLVEEQAQNETFNSQIGLLKVHLTKAMKNNTKVTNIIEPIANDLLFKYKNSPDSKLKIFVQLIKSNLHDNHLEEVKRLLSEYSLILREYKIAQPEIINQYFVLKSKYLLKKKQYDEAETLLNIALQKQTIKQNSGDVEIASQKNPETLGNQLVLEIALTKVYLEQGSGKANDQLHHILSKFPNNQFARKHIV